MHSLFDCNFHLTNGIPEKGDRNQSERFYRYQFYVPENCGELTLSMDIDTVKPTQIPLVLFDASGEVRLMRTANATCGKAHISYTIAPAYCDKGCIPGKIPEGMWKLILYKRRMSGDVDAHVSSFFQYASEMQPETQVEAKEISGLQEKPFSSAVLSETPGWYCGELHVHSDESTGHTSLEEVIDAARKVNLDFIAITDHFTKAHWIKLQEIGCKEPPLLLQSMEVSGDFGHANVHGLKTWQNPLVDDNVELSKFLGMEKAPSMEQIADKVHEDGGLFAINHALSGIMGWRYRDFPMAKADLYEVCCTSELQTSFLYSTHYDMLLCQGFHLTGIGSSDSHHPTEGTWKLGEVRTWVYADSLSQNGILSGLKAGHAYVGIKGVQMNFTCSVCGSIFHMGDTVSMRKGNKAEFTLSIFSHPRGNLFIYGDGFIVDTIYFDNAGNDTYTFTLDEKWIKKSGESYVRIEFHEMSEPPKFYGMAFRDHTTVRLLSNPIWLKREE